MKKESKEKRDREREREREWQAEEKGRHWILFSKIKRKQTNKTITKQTRNNHKATKNKEGLEPSELPSPPQKRPPTQHAPKNKLLQKLRLAQKTGATENFHNFADIWENKVYFHLGAVKLLEKVPFS